MHQASTILPVGRNIGNIGMKLTVNKTSLMLNSILEYGNPAKKGLKHAFQCENVKDLVFECVTPSDHFLAGPHALSGPPRTP